ncbi:MAG TPA: glycoside hydrolase family 3 N-terminal domain-containing protein [Candidatus Acidoferrales bacterium]|nr:glycoside hydrolase family 3 N-terminal domain-containing protein [Candidatus Acidoferrales bacterium]
MPSLVRTRPLARVSFVLLLALAFFAPSLLAQTTPPYRDPKLPIEQRISDLLSRMTLEEKIAQMGSAWENPGFRNVQKTFFVDEKGAFLPDQAAIVLKDGLGQISRPGEGRNARAMAEYTNTVQKWVHENTRLGIPILFHVECLHGFVAPGATSFPQAIALASTWDPALVNSVFTATAAEVRAAGAQQCLAPDLDLARDPRWGRTEETYGEDPYLVSQIGLAAIRGFQGAGPYFDKAHVTATAKHFAVHGEPESGTNVGPGNYSERVIREYFLRPFEVAVKQGHIANVMPSYNEIDGIPSHSNKHLLEDILRQEWGFQGAVTSDYFGITELRTVHHIVPDNAAAGRLALDAGVDVELPFFAGYPNLIDEVKQGLVSESQIDIAVARVLRIKFLTGLFDDPYVDPSYAEKITNSPEHQQLSLKAAHEAIILLKNEGHLLPLAKGKYKKIAVIGPDAAEVHLGGYSDNPGRGVSLLQGIKNKVGSSAEVLYALGCKITESDPDWNADKVVLGDPALNAKRIDEAVAVARKADVVILALGGNEQTSREAWAVNHPGDRDNLDLLGNQDDLAKAILATGKPVVVFLQHGRPNSINFLAEHVPAILDGFYLGQEGGTAMADVLFGDYNPAGRLPITVPRSVGQLPDYYYQKPSAHREYLGASTLPLYPFGWGLSYTDFKYSNLKVTPGAIGPLGSAKVSVDVTNTGSVRGDEVVQLYIHQEYSLVTRPVKELRGFRRITLDPGQTQTVDFTLGPEELSYLNREMKRVVEPAPFDIMVGGNSIDLITAKLNVTAP